MNATTLEPLAATNIEDAKCTMYYSFFAYVFGHLSSRTRHRLFDVAALDKSLSMV